jgi:taurine dioxygenase
MTLLAEVETKIFDSAPFEIEPINPSIGAEISGLDLSQPMDEATFAALEAALIEYKIIYMRDQHITADRHVEIGQMFGELEHNPFRPEGGVPQIMRLDNHKDNPVLSTDVWHADTTFRQNPTKYSILRAVIVPQFGGDTLWSDMTAAYDNLSQPIKDMIDRLEAVHDFLNFRRLFSDTPEDQAALHEMEKRFPRPTHPVVRTHPVTGRKAIFVNPQFVVRIKDLSDAESRAILDLLYQQARIPEYQFRLRWKPGTIAFWDNRSVQHYASNDYYPNRRLMERVAIVGDKPV